MIRQCLLGTVLLIFTLVSCKEDCGELTWFVDEDGDGYGNPADTLLLIGCNRPEGYVLDNTDCDDTDENIHPGAAETPNDGVDSDCNGEEEYALWSGPLITFTKDALADWTLASNQDTNTSHTHHIPHHISSHISISHINITYHRVKKHQASSLSVTK